MDAGGHQLEGRQQPVGLRDRAPRAQGKRAPEPVAERAQHRDESGRHDHGVRSWSHFEQRSINVDEHCPIGCVGPQPIRP